MDYLEVKERAVTLFETAPYIAHIHNDAEYESALGLMEDLLEESDRYPGLIEVLSVAIDRWETESGGFQEFNQAINELDGGVAVLRTLMEQHGLGMSDLPELGSKSLVSRILSGQRQLTRRHIDALSKRFGVNPQLFFV